MIRPANCGLGQGHIVGVHAKDTLPGTFRGVPFGRGIVPFGRAFAALAQMGFAGPVTVEMWSQMDATGDPVSTARNARRFVGDLISTEWVHPTPERENL